MRKAFLSVLLVSLATLARAQAPPRAGGEFRINTFTTGEQAVASASADAAGRYVVVWQSQGPDGAGYGIVGRRFDAAGAPIGGEFVVNQYTTSDQGSASVASAPDGHFLVTWTSVGEDGSGLGLFGRAFLASGEPASPEFAVNNSTIGNQDVSRVASIPGGFIVVWQNDSYVGFGRLFRPDGSAVSPEFRISAFTTSQQVTPVAAGLPNGAYVLAWATPAPAFYSHSHVFVRLYDTSGPQGPETQADARFANDMNDLRRSPAIVTRPDGAFTVAWDTTGCFVGDGIFCSNNFVEAREYDADGTPLAVESTVDQAGNSITFDPALGVGPRGIQLVAWTSTGRAQACNPPFFCEPAEFQDGSGASVYARRFGSVLSSPEFRVNTFTTGDQSAPAVATDPFGNALVVWESAGQDGSLRGVYGQRFGGLIPSAVDLDTSGNHVLEPGENVDLRPAWRNTTGASQSFTGSISNLTGPAFGNYTITDGTGSYGTSAAGSTTPCVDCYGVAVSTSARGATHWDASVLETLAPAQHGQQVRWPLHIGNSFTDVPASNPFYRFVETLLHRGVTAGCTATTYCPSVATTREQMAVFVLVAKEGAGYTPPACVPPNIFTDVPETSPFCRYVEELANRGVVGGCAANQYCGGSPVTREQMAVFVLRTLDPALDPPACVPPNIFNDMPETSPFCRWVEELANRGIVSGCAPGQYCGTAPVTREQMGVFLGVTFGLTLYGS